MFLIEPDMEVMADYISHQHTSELNFRGIDFGKFMESIKMKQWITKDEYLPLKAEIDFKIEDFEKAFYESISQEPDVLFENENLKASVTVNIQVRLGDFNEPVVIELPPEALEAEESPVRY